MSDPHDPRSVAAGLLRDFGHEFVAHDMDDATIEDVSRRIRELLEVVGPTPRRQRHFDASSYEHFSSAVPEHGQGQPRQLFNDSIVSGASNPMGLGAYLWRSGDQAVMEVTLGKAFEGAPERAHGGVVAALVDEAMGLVLAIHHSMAFTVQLNISYRAPTPVNTPLIARAWLDRRDGRKLHMKATVSANDEVVVEADGIFIAIESYLPPT